MLHLVKKQAYKLGLSKKWRIYDVFYVSLLDQDNIKKERVENIPKLNTGDNNKEYKIETIWDSAIYIMKLELSQLPELYYLVAWKGYPKKEKT